MVNIKTLKHEKGHKNSSTNKKVSCFKTYINIFNNKAK